MARMERYLGPNPPSICVWFASDKVARAALANTHVHNTGVSLRASVLNLFDRFIHCKL